MWLKDSSRTFNSSRPDSCLFIFIFDEERLSRLIACVAAASSASGWRIKTV